MPSPHRSERRPAPASRLPDALRALEALKEPFYAESARAARLRPCSGCGDCCRFPANAMLATPLEAEALLRRIDTDPALRARRAELIGRVRAAVRQFGLRGRPLEGPPRPFTCPFYEEADGGRCLVHGSGQPVGCAAYKPVGVSRCDMPVARFTQAVTRLQELDREGLGRSGEPVEIPLAVLRRLEARARAAAKIPKKRGSGPRARGGGAT